MPPGVVSAAMPTLEELREDVAAGTVDTVIVCFTDMQGRLMGKRLDAEFFLSEQAAGHPGEGCNYLLALEMEMDPVPGYAIASWERGYGDFGLRPDLPVLLVTGGSQGAASLNRAVATSSNDEEYA